MKKIISLLLTFMLVFSLAFAMTSCDNGENSSGDNSSSDGNGSGTGSDDTGNDNTDGGDNTGTGSGDTGSTGGSDNTGDDNTGSGDTGSDDNTGSGDDSTDSDAKKLVGIAKNVDDFSHDQSSKLTLRLEADTETVVYVLLSSEVENLSLLINVYPGSSVITADLTVDDYDERLGVYVAKITIPASEQNTTYEAHLCIDGEKIGEKFRISIPKVEYVDPNGSNPV